MDINLKKRHIVMFFAIIFALFLIIPSCQTIQKILKAKDISELDGKYNYNEYVKVDFDKILYMEYEGVYGGTQKRHAVCSTLDGDVFYVNGMPNKYILVEITNTQTIEDIETSLKKHYQVIGILEKNTFDTKEFLEKINPNVEFDNTIIVKQTEYQDIYITKIINGCFIILFCIIFFYYWGGIHSIARKKS